jgi:murein DD-endopeptidase MepM/ murein hydrolase activator NlpD
VVELAINQKRFVFLVCVVIGLSACDGRPSPSPAAVTVPPSPTVDELATLIAMQHAATEVPTATPWPTHTPTSTPSPTLSPTATATPEATNTLPPVYTIYPTNTPRATSTPFQGTAATSTPDPVQLDHYWFVRPFPRDPTNMVHDYLSRNYAYGTTSGGQFAVHHGVDIQNNYGTPILAVASGWVIYAGGDQTQLFGPKYDFYGNLVVIEHDFVAPTGEKLYSLYGHMSKVDVEAGQHINQLDKIGEVGATGVALGSHLHFEVRIGDPYDYNNTYNPDLWLRPWPGYGVLAGRVIDQSGNFIHDATIQIRSESGPVRATSSYADDTVNPDPGWGENYAYGDLPEGDYQITAQLGNGPRYRGTVHIVAGQTTWLEIVLR